MSDTQKQELGQILILALRDFQHRLDRDLKLRGVRAIRGKQRLVFMHLDRHGASRSVDLAAAAGIRPQSMMKIVHELEREGLVSRAADPADSRAKLVQFTAAGQRLIDELSRSTATVWEQYAALVGEADMEQTVAVLRQLAVQGREEAGS